MTSDRYPQLGLTLLEMMVVLMIASMAVALGFQSLGQWQRANTAIAGAGGDIQQAMLTEAWLKSSINSLIPIEGDTFQGSPVAFEGVTLQPVFAHQGGATPIRWSLTTAPRGPTLTLLEHGKSFSLPLPSATSAKFQYLDRDGKTHDRWPPKTAAQDYLPHAVTLLQAGADRPTTVWVMSVAGSKNLVVTPFEAGFD